MWFEMSFHILNDISSNISCYILHGISKTLIRNDSLYVILNNISSYVSTDNLCDLLSDILSDISGGI